MILSKYYICSSRLGMPLAWDSYVLGAILGMYMESHLGLLLEHSWALYMDPLIVLMMSSLRGYCLETNWNLLMVNCMAPMKASNW